MPQLSNRKKRRQRYESLLYKNAHMMAKIHGVSFRNTKQLLISAK